MFTDGMKINWPYPAVTDRKEWWDTERRLDALFLFQISPGQEMYDLELTRIVLK